jgi:ATP-dependent Clp protease ATP-binding subunit ClpC
MVDFKNTVIIMTTNLGTRDITKGSLGFSAGPDTRSDYERMKNKVTDELKNHFRPEFLNRVDDTSSSRSSRRTRSSQIVDLEIAKLDKRLRDKDMGLELTPAAKALLAKKGYDPVLGARPLRRTIQREIEDSTESSVAVSLSWSMPLATRRTPPSRLPGRCERIRFLTFRTFPRRKMHRPALLEPEAGEALRRSVGVVPSGHGRRGA